MCITVSNHVITDYTFDMSVCPSPQLFLVGLCGNHVQLHNFPVASSDH